MAIGVRDYWDRVRHLWAPDRPRADRLASAALGLCGEAGEAADHVKKHLFHDRALDRAAVVRELGDVLFYVAAVAHEVGADLDEVAEGNVAKLAARYPVGYSHQASAQRRDEMPPPAPGILGGYGRGEAALLPPLPADSQRAYAEGLEVGVR